MTELPIIVQLAEAGSDAARARFLLGLPDGVVKDEAGALVEACREARFHDGHDYLACRLAALLARRDGQGLLCDEVVFPLTLARLRLVAIAHAHEASP